MSQRKNTYGAILKSTSLTGGSQVISTVIGMLRIKFAAVLLGPAGIGLIGTYMAIQQFVVSLAGMGINQSGVRDISSARATGDQVRVAETVGVVRRLSLWLGLLGALIIVAISWPLSRFTFGDGEHVFSIMALGISVLITLISAAQSAVVRGHRKIAELARVSVSSSAIGTCVAIALYFSFGLQGVIPAILLQSCIALTLSWQASRRIQIERVELSFEKIRLHAKSLLGLGLAFMWTALLGAAMAYLVRLIIAREMDLAAVGIYAAAYAISVRVVTMVTSAMGADYLPRLSEVADDHPRVVQLVNEQAEVGLLLALPMMFGLILFAPFLIEILYTEEFAQSLPLIHLFALGCFMRVFSWPLGFVLMAMKKGALFSVLQTAFFALHVGQILLYIQVYSITGVAIAFLLNAIIYSMTIYIVLCRICGFKWARDTFHLLLVSIFTLSSAYIACTYFNGIYTFIAFLLLWAGLIVYCLRSLCLRVADNSKVAKALARLPGFVRRIVVPSVSS